MWDRGFAYRWIALFLFLAFLALLALGVVALWRRGSSGAGPVSPGVDEAVSTLRMRYARGEMTAEEFLQANEVLGGPPPTNPPPTTPPA